MKRGAALSLSPLPTSNNRQQGLRQAGYQPDMMQHGTAGWGGACFRRHLKLCTPGWLGELAAA